MLRRVSFDVVKALPNGMQFLRYDKVARRWSVRSSSASLRAVFDGGWQFIYFLLPEEVL